MMCFLWQHEKYLWYLPGTACLYSGPSHVDLAFLRNHLLHACRYWYCGCHPQDTAVGRDRAHYSFSSIRAVVYGFSSNYYKIKNVSCEIEDFIETHLCKLRGIFRSRVLRVLCNLIENVSPHWGGQNLTASCGTQWTYKSVAEDMYATLFTIGHNLINSSMRE